MLGKEDKAYYTSLSAAELQHDLSVLEEELDWLQAMEPTEETLAEIREQKQEIKYLTKLSKTNNLSN